MVYFRRRRAIIYPVYLALQLCHACRSRYARLGPPLSSGRFYMAYALCGTHTISDAMGDFVAFILIIIHVHMRRLKVKESDYKKYNYFVFVVWCGVTKASRMTKGKVRFLKKLVGFRKFDITLSVQ